jgi:hypothetical protein
MRGPATNTNYGRRQDGDVFTVFEKDVEPLVKDETVRIEVV